MHVRFLGEDDDGISLSSHHAHLLADLGITTSFEEPIDSISRAVLPIDVVHLVSFEQRNYAMLRRLVALRRSGAEIIRFWTGRGVLWVRHHKPTLHFALAVADLGAVQFARTESMMEDLADLGIETSLGPIASSRVFSTARPEPLPAMFTVLCDLPRDRMAFHGDGVIASLAEQLPQIRFLVLRGDKEITPETANVEVLGQVEDVVRAIQRSTVTVLARLDGGISRLALETLCQGRHVIMSCKWPYCEFADTLPALVRAIRRLADSPSFNLEGREYACREFDRAKTGRELFEVLEQCRNTSGWKGKLGACWSAFFVALRAPGVLSKKRFPLPSLDALSPSARAMRSLLEEHDSQKSRTDECSFP